MVTVPPIPMPARGHATALKFSPDQPCKLHCYFSELENLLAAASITVDNQKKLQACHYLDFELAELWQAIPTFTGETYDIWKEALYKLYPGTEADKNYTVADMDKLVGE